MSSGNLQELWARGQSIYPNLGKHRMSRLAWLLATDLHVCFPKADFALGCLGTRWNFLHKRWITYNVYHCLDHLDIIKSVCLSDLSGRVRPLLPTGCTIYIYLLDIIAYSWSKACFFPLSVVVPMCFSITNSTSGPLGTLALASLASSFAWTGSQTWREYHPTWRDRLWSINIWWYDMINIYLSIIYHIMPSKKNICKHHWKTMGVYFSSTQKLALGLA